MKLSTKLTASMMTLVAIILGLGVFSLLQLNQINESANEIATDWLTKTRLYGRLNTQISDYRVSEIMHVLSADQAEMKAYSQSLNGLAKGVEETRKEVLPYITLPEAKKLFATVEQTWTDYNKVHEEILQDSFDYKNDEALILLKGASLDLYNKLGSTLTDLTSVNTKASLRVADQSKAMYNSSYILIVGVIVVSCLIALGIAFYLITNIGKLLGKDPAELGNIAKRVVDGDYNIDDGSQKVGVYGSIVHMVKALKDNMDFATQESEKAKEASAHALASMQEAEAATKRAESAKREGMLTAASQLEEVVGIVASASQELSAQIEQSERGTAQSSMRMAETATAMEEMNSTVSEVARNASQAAHLSKQTREKAASGANIVDVVVRSVQKVHDDSLILKNDMNALSEKAQDISRIMDVISDIADQTNLLALNAAIEAARAGEAGKGFAVVADEVRNLAEKTMHSTADVGNAIHSIQESAMKSMKQVEATMKNIEAATLEATHSGEALVEIVSMVDASSDQVNAIATASEQQSATSEEINRTMANVNAITSETSKAMHEAAFAIADLAKQAQVLDTLIDNMKKG